MSIKGDNMDNKGIHHEKYEHSEKYRAETFRFVGYALATPFCAITLQLLAQDPTTITNQPYFWMRLLISIALLMPAYGFATQGLGAMVKLDRRIQK